MRTVKFLASEQNVALDVVFLTKNIPGIGHASKYCQGKPPGKVSGLPGAESSVAPPVQPEMDAHQNTDNGAQGIIKDDVDNDSIDDDVQKLTMPLKKLELEEEALVKKNKLAELQKLVEAKKKSIEVLKSNIASGTNHNVSSAGPSSAIFDTKALKKLAGKSPGQVPDSSAPLDNLLYGAAALGNSNGPNDFEDLLKFAYHKASDPAFNWTAGNAGISASIGDVVGNTLDAAGAADMLLKTKKTSGRPKTYFHIVDFVDNICQKDDERLLAEHGITCLMINYGPKKLKLHEISMQQYVIGAIRNLVELLDSKQFYSLDGIKQYFGYLIKIMELAMRFEWKSVLEFDDSFSQLQIFYGVPWVHEIHHLHLFKLVPLQVGYPNLTCRKFSTDSHSHPSDARRKNFQKFTIDDREMCRHFNRPEGCNLLDCKFAHLCNVSITRPVGKTIPVVGMTILD